MEFKDHCGHILPILPLLLKVKDICIGLKIYIVIKTSPVLFHTLAGRAIESKLRDAGNLLFKFINEEEEAFSVLDIYHELIPYSPLMSDPNSLNLVPICISHISK